MVNSRKRYGTRYFGWTPSTSNSIPKTVAITKSLKQLCHDFLEDNQTDIDSDGVPDLEETDNESSISSGSCASEGEDKYIFLHEEPQAPEGVDPLTVPYKTRQGCEVKAPD